MHSIPMLHPRTSVPNPLRPLVNRAQAPTPLKARVARVFASAHSQPTGHNAARHLLRRRWSQSALGLAGVLWVSFWPELGAATEFNTLQPAQSTLLFAYKQMNVPMEGRFKTFAAQLHFDPAKPAQGKAVLEAPIASLDTGSDEANDEVGAAAWFNSKKFPTARFESTTIQPLGGNRYEVSGPLTIKGHTRLVSAPVTVAIQGNRAVFDGSFDVRRADFSVGEGTWADFGTVANEIHIKFHLVTTP